MDKDYSDKTLYILLGVNDYELQLHAAAKLYSNAGCITYWDNTNQPDFTADGLLTSRIAQLTEFLASDATEQIWADSWIEQLDAWYQEHGVYDSASLLQLLHKLQQAADAGLAVKFVLTPTDKAERMRADKSTSKFFADSLLMKQKQANASALTAIDASIDGLLDLLPNSTLQSVTLED